MTGLCGVFCLTLWVPAQSYELLLTFALLAGTVCGTFWGTVAPVTAEVVGLRRLPSAFGMICLPLVLPTVFAEPIALQLVSASGYLTSKVFVGCMFLLGAISTWGLRSWKICDNENSDKKEREQRSDDNTTESEGDRIWLTPRRLFLNRRV